MCISEREARGPFLVLKLTIWDFLGLEIFTRLILGNKILAKLFLGLIKSVHTSQFSISHQTIIVLVSLRN